jgi:heme/copper-type cytochrome/quinol oxidase subunit 3
MESRFLRIVYAIQFVVTLMAIFEVWAQVGGQGHLDLMPWYWKLLLAAALSLATVKATVAAVNRDRFWNKWTFAWLATALALMAVMGVLTYYEHLHEPADEGDEAPEQLHLSRSQTNIPDATGELPLLSYSAAAARVFPARP